MTIWNRITATRAASALADWISGGALSEARKGQKENWTEAQSNWRVAQERMAKLERAEGETRAMAKAHRQQMDQISAELSDLIAERPQSEHASKLRAIRALTKG